MPVIWTLLSFVAGSIPFSYLLGRLALNKDIRRFGDGNPGATNVGLAGGKGWGFLALLLDGFKGAISVGWAHLGAGLSGSALLPVALAPVLGHAYSPWLRGRGGKAVAVSFGVWAGLTLGEAPILLGLFLGLWFSVVARSGWAITLAMLCLLGHLLLNHPDPLLLAFWAGDMALLGWKYRQDLLHAPGLRPWLHRRLSG